MPNVIMSYHEYKMKKEQDKFDTKHGKKLKEPICESTAAAGGKKNNRACENGGKKMLNKSATAKRSEKSEAKETVEKKITIMPNPAAKRGSLASFAFPELHPKTKKNNEPENLLVLTTTRTDERGRRHSVAVPLIPPPDGEKFEGGYYIERNPITGGARLVPPASEKSSGRRSRSFVKRTNSYMSKDLSTISESSMLSGRTVKRKLKDTQNGESPPNSRDQPSPSNNYRDGSRSPGQSQSLLAPPVSRSRRHSLQPSMSPLSKDMERLKLAEKSSKSAKDRKSVERRSTSKRRSSKQGFLHFLDLAIAN